MKLLLDLGNSRCKYAHMHSDDSIQYGVQSYSPFGKLYAVKSLCDKYKNVEQVIISSVQSKKMNAEIASTLFEKNKKDVYFLNPVENSFGIQLSYDDPSTIGADRVAALIATHDKYAGNSCIIDCGTAVTIDAIDGKGKHLGGVIMPGYVLMNDGLLENTKIKMNQQSENFSLHANSTETAIYTGCISAVVGGIEYVVNKMSSDFDTFSNVILTGGAVEKLNEHFTSSFQSLPILRDENLILDGLKVVTENI